MIVGIFETNRSKINYIYSINHVIRFSYYGYGFVDVVTRVRYKITIEECDSY